MDPLHPLTTENSPLKSSTPQPVILVVVSSLSLLSIIGFVGTIILCKSSADPLLIKAAVDLITANPANAAMAIDLIQVDGTTIAIVAGMTGTAIGLLGSILSNTRTISNETSNDTTSSRVQSTTVTKIESPAPGATPPPAEPPAA